MLKYLQLLIFCWHFNIDKKKTHHLSKPVLFSIFLLCTVEVTTQRYSVIASSLLIRTVKIMLFQGAIASLTKCLAIDEAVNGVRVNA